MIWIAVWDFLTNTPASTLPTLLSHIAVWVIFFLYFVNFSWKTSTVYTDIAFLRMQHVLTFCHIFVSPPPRTLSPSGPLHWICVVNLAKLHFPEFTSVHSVTNCRGSDFAHTVHGSSRRHETPRLQIEDFITHSIAGCISFLFIQLILYSTPQPKQKTKNPSQSFIMGCKQICPTFALESDSIILLSDYTAEETNLPSAPEEDTISFLQGCSLYKYLLKGILPIACGI